MEAEIAPDKKLKNDVAAVELPAPPGWTKKVTPKPRKNQIAFVSPTGEELKSKKKLQQYLKSHPGGPSAAEFDWSSGGTPRRSARLSGKSNAENSPESETPRKRQKAAKRKVPEKEESEVDEGDNADEKEDTAEEIKEDAEVTAGDAEDGGKQKDGEDVTEESLLTKGDGELRSDAGEIVTKEAVPDEDMKDGKLETEENAVAKDAKQETEDIDTGNMPCDAKNEKSESRSLSSSGAEDTIKAAETESNLTKASSDLPTSNENPPSTQVSDVPEDPSLKVADEEPAKVEQTIEPNNDASAEKLEGKETSSKKDESLKSDEESPPKINE